jgi:hypothetical protein
LTQQPPRHLLLLQQHQLGWQNCLHLSLCPQMLLVVLLLRCQQDWCCQQRHLRLHRVLTAVLGVCRTAAQHQKQQ